MADDPPRLNPADVTVVYTMYDHLGDFVAMGGLLKKFDQLGAGFESLAVHRGSPYVPLFDGPTAGRFFDATRLPELLSLVGKLQREKERGRLIFGVPMAPGSLQAHFFFRLLKALGALTYIVDFNLNNADILTPPRRRYIFDRHLAQAAELFRRPEWLDDTSMPLAVAGPAVVPKPARSTQRIGFFPWSGRRALPEFRWPETRWQSLARLLLKGADSEIVLLGRDDDFTPFEQSLRASLPEEMQSRLLAAPSASVPELVATLREVDMLVTLNTSALHLAHALKLPVVALCGSSAEFWRPGGAHVRMVADELGVLPPSDKYGHDPRQPSLQRIEVAAVFAACQELAAGRAA